MHSTRRFRGKLGLGPENNEKWEEHGRTIEIVIYLELSTKLRTLSFPEKESSYLLDLPSVRSCVRILAALGLFPSASKYSMHPYAIISIIKNSALFRGSPARQCFRRDYRSPESAEGEDGEFGGLEAYGEGLVRKCKENVGAVGFAVGCAMLCYVAACCWFMIWSSLRCASVILAMLHGNSSVSSLDSLCTLLHILGTVPFQETFYARIF